MRGHSVGDGFRVPKRALAMWSVAAGLAAVLATSCALPRIHRVTVQQGNVITQEMVDQLKPGMTREQVAFVMGQPVVRNAFDDTRWDYVYTIDVPGSFESRLLVSLYFAGDELARITGDLAPQPAAPEQTAEAAPP